MSSEPRAGNRAGVKDALLIVDAINTFEHEDGDRLLASFRERLPGFRHALDDARGAACR